MSSDGFATAITVLIAGAIIAATMAWLASDSRDCAAKGGVLVRGVWGTECVEQKP